MTTITVDVQIHHRVGAEVRVTTMQGVTRHVAEEFIKGLGSLRKEDGCLTLGPMDSIQVGIPARNIELVEIKGGRWT